jgi:uncharacterized protein
MKNIITWAVMILVAFATVARAEISAEKRKEVDELLRLTGLEKLMTQMRDQMITSMTSGNTRIPPEVVKRLSAKMDIREVLEKIVPIYDKYYSLEDLRAVNAFYASPAGQKVLSSLPQVMQESMAVGQQWGEKAGRELAAELAAEAKEKKR